MKRWEIIKLIERLYRGMQEEVSILLMDLVILARKKKILRIGNSLEEKKVKQYIRNNIRKYYETIDRRSDEENLFFKYNGRWYFYKSRAWDVLKLFNEMSGKYLINDSTKLLKYLN